MVPGSQIREVRGTVKNKGQADRTFSMYCFRSYDPKRVSEQLTSFGWEEQFSVICGGIQADILMLHISQRRLELLIGLSQGYLSRLRIGAGNPSAELVSHLAMLAHDPKTRLAELERYWAVGL